MDRLLRPDRFETEPNAPNADKLYEHWKLTFQNYINTTLSRHTTPTGSDSSISDATLARNKLFALIAYQPTFLI